MHRRRMIVLIILVLAGSAYLYWHLTTPRVETVAGTLTGSGTVEATAVTISPETFGRVTDVLVNEGDKVNVGDMLFKLDSTLLSAQISQAQVNLNAAQAGLVVAQEAYTSTLTSVDIARAQYNLALAQALQQAQPLRIAAWSQAAPDEFNQPGWYYTHTEQLNAARDELNSAKTVFENEQVNFDNLRSTDAYTNLSATESRLAKARVAFLDAQDVLNRLQQQNDQVLIDAAQQDYDDAKNELTEAQRAYNDLLTDQEVNNILRARAMLVVAQERYDTAQDRYTALQTGQDSPQVQVAAATLAQAQSNVTLAKSKLTQAQSLIDQAQVALDLVNVQLGKLTITAPVSGVILARNIEPGEVIQPGASAITLGELQHLTITVYIPENRYGELKLGDSAQVTVDSFPAKSFTATVTRIAEQAEFTPRNVQTVEGRSTTVYAVQLAVQNPEGLLKPGMPADVMFTHP